MSTSTPPPRFLIWGHGGWVAGMLEDLLKKQGKDFQTTAYRMEDQAAVCRVLDNVKPTHVINCAGKTGRPNVDWCEDHKLETIRSNVLGTLIVADECEKRGIHLTLMATGCIYRSTYTPDHTQLLSSPFTEDAPANFGGSFYSYTKSRVEDVLRNYPNTLILRLRMPVSDDISPRNFVTKIARYERVVNVPNSNSILHDLLPVAVALAEHKEEGVMNFTNPGAIGHNEVLSLYRDIVKPSFTWKNFSMEEQAKVIKADRSNCELDVGRLMGLVEKYRAEGCELEVPEIHEAYRRCFGRMKENLEGAGQQRGGAQVKAA